MSRIVRKLTSLLSNDSHIITVPVMINFCLGRVYTHTMLYGLNLRRRFQTGSSGDVHTSGDITNISTGPPIDLSGIRESIFVLHMIHEVEFAAEVQRSVQVEDGTAPSPLKNAAR
jgi:hypothetical protein